MIILNLSSGLHRIHLGHKIINKLEFFGNHDKVWLYSMKKNSGLNCLNLRILSFELLNVINYLSKSSIFDNITAL